MGEPRAVAVGAGVVVTVGVEEGTGVIVGKTNGTAKGTLVTTAPGSQRPLTNKYQVPSVYKPIIIT
jgi:hypothetical protein